MHVHRSVVEPVLGTRLTVRIDATDPATARRAEDAAVDEADRLEALLSAYRPDSAFSRWRAGLLDDLPDEVVAVLTAAADWFTRTGGAFHPGLAEVTARWRRAVDEQLPPSDDELAELAANAAVLPFVVDAGRVLRTGDCRRVDVHGLAKGWVVDRMVDAALGVEGVSAVLVDLGGDLCQRGAAAEGAIVAVEHPFTVADNAAPLATVRLRDQAIATSAGGRRGFRIAGSWYGHLLDPRTGMPLPHRRSATVVAPCAAVADAAASAFAVLDTDAAAGLATREQLAVLTVTEGGDEWRSDAWPGTTGERSERGEPDQQDRDQ